MRFFGERFTRGTSDKNLDAELLRSEEERKIADLEEGLSRWHVEEQDKRIAEQQEHVIELEQKFDIDPLTELPNRRYFQRELELLLAHMYQKIEEHRKDMAEPIKKLSVAFIDLDNFKKVNDTFGHEEGDATIKIAARIMKDSFRSKDIVARPHGDEFVVIFPNTDGDTAATLAERVRMAIESEPTLRKYGVTVSIGICEAVSDLPIDSTKLLGRADKALYAAKRAGRNKVEVYNSKDKTNY